MFSLVSASRASLLNRLSAALAAESVARCFTVEDREAHVRHRVAPAGRRVAFAVSEALAGAYSKGSTASAVHGGLRSSRRSAPTPTAATSSR
jgi:hypothetical protein